MNSTTPWLLKMIVLWLLNAVLTLALMNGLKVSYNLQAYGFLYALLGFPILYMFLTGVIVPLFRRDFKTAARRGVAAAGVCAVLAFLIGASQLVVPSVIFLIVLWLYSLSDSSGAKRSSEAAGSNSRNTAAQDWRDKENDRRARNNEGPV